MISLLFQDDVALFLGSSAVLLVAWLAHETAPVRRRNAALRRARKNNSGS